MKLNQRPALFVDPVFLEGGVKRYRIWCEYCDDWHYHGPLEGSRECNCTEPNSPYHLTGYEVRRRSIIDGLIGGRS